MSDTMATDCLVSIVIPTYNSELTLPVCLKSIKNQTHKNIEIIVVDKCSSDKTVEIALLYGAKVIRIPANERCEQMNLGVKNASGKYIDIAGSDFFLEPSVIEEAVDECEIRGFDAICIHNTSDSSVSFWAKVRKLERDCYVDDELNVAAGFMKKSVFEAIGGYNNELVANEDYDLHNRLLAHHFKIGRIKAKEIHIGEPKTLSEIVRKHIYYGTKINAFLSASGSRGVKQTSFIRSAYLRHWRDFLNDPVVTCGFVFYQFIRYSSTLLGIIVNDSSSSNVKDISEN
jgi:glycosyltransferase involved in cell wall biosynthesis